MPFNHLHSPTDIAVLVVLRRLRNKLSLRNVSRMILTRGFTVIHVTVRAGEERLAPRLTARLTARRRGKAGRTWHVNETYVKVTGRWCYLYQAIDSDGKLVETILSKTRDISTLRTRGMPMLAALGHVVVGTPPLPVTAWPRSLG